MFLTAGFCSLYSPVRQIYLMLYIRCCKLDGKLSLVGKWQVLVHSQPIIKSIRLKLRITYDQKNRCRSVIWLILAMMGWGWSKTYHICTYQGNFFSPNIQHLIYYSKYHWRTELMISFLLSASSCYAFLNSKFIHKLGGFLF